MDKILSRVYTDTDEEMKLEIKETKKIGNPILDDYALRYTKEELTEDGIPTIETQLKELAIKDEETNKKLEEDKDRLYRREMIQRVKCLALHSMGKDIMTNTMSLSERERRRLQDIMYTYNDVPHDEIIKDFNELATEVIFDNSNIDISKLPIYQV
jgi:hypothetical protein